jgi:hypothetical protein
MATTPHLKFCGGPASVTSTLRWPGVSSAVWAVSAVMFVARPAVRWMPIIHSEQSRGRRGDSCRRSGGLPAGSLPKPAAPLQRLSLQHPPHQPSRARPKTRARDALFHVKRGPGLPLN